MQLRQSPKRLCFLYDRPPFSSFTTLLGTPLFETPLYFSSDALLIRPVQRSTKCTFRDSSSKSISLKCYISQERGWENWGAEGFNGQATWLGFYAAAALSIRGLVHIYQFVVPCHCCCHFPVVVVVYGAQAVAFSRNLQANFVSVAPPTSHHPLPLAD